ncbi:unnamed protein product [Notodromas monacha]|uniref:Uncharacterized protein n=1 Tax=Notodromas monacha TaxID=399045 RepID=A0A7R9C1S8_9CRUS|nr:unnamed protein product [Notodromas monacha]CAG0925820.1 unnamed protein product [Notodromas monacha]
MVSGYSAVSSMNFLLC